MARAARRTWSFPKSARLLRRSEFVRLRRAEAMADGPLAASWAPRAAAQPTRPGMAPATARVGLVVSAKVGGAVQRNRVKRRLREAVRHELHRFPAVDVVLVARGSATAATLDELRGWVRRLAARVASAQETTP
jgi:ribonuclease P protein component